MCTKLRPAFILSLAILVSAAVGQGQKRQTSLQTKVQVAPGAATLPRCEVAGTKAIRISCHYIAFPASGPGSDRDSRVVLNDAVLSFETRTDNYMHVDLTFTNDGKNAISDAYLVYLAIDNEAGNNYVRRLLPHVDFRNLAPGIPQTFSERLLTPAFQPRQYAVRLWIPNPDPSLKFNPEHNLLLSSVGVADPRSGLNLIAKFSVTR